MERYVEMLGYRSIGHPIREVNGKHPLGATAGGFFPEIAYRGWLLYRCAGQIATAQYRTALRTLAGT